MNKDSITISSSISNALLRHTLLRGFILGCLGAAILLIGGIFLLPSFLLEWGWALFLFAMGLITWGLLPYRRMARLQLNPYRLQLIDATHVVFSDRGKPLMTLPLNSLASSKWISNGIALTFKTPPPEPIVIHANPESVEKLRFLGRKQGCDLLLPHFSQRAFEEWLEWQKEPDSASDSPKDES